MLAVAALVPLTLLLVFGPGFLVVRTFRWTPVETLAASVGLSLTLLFVVSFAAFWARAPAWVDISITVTAAALSVAAWLHARQLWRATVVRRAVYSLAALGTWTFLLLLLIRQYGGGNSCCDWLEHYQRTQHFMSPLPDEFLYIGRYLLPSRPPLMNAVAAHIIGTGALQFPVFQVTFSLLNVLVLLACCAVSSVVSPTGRPADPRLLAVLLAANPMFFMNTTLPWTKVLTAFFVLLGVALYIAGRRTGDRRRIAGAFLALGSAILTHYSAVPYALVIGMHYAVNALRSRSVTWRSVAFVAAPAVVLLSLWIGFVVSTYGVTRGIVRNPSFEGTATASPAEHFRTRSLNLIDSLIPRAYTGYNGYPEDATPRRWVSDQIYTAYQSNMILSMGLVNGPLVVILAVMALRRARRVDERRFWIYFLPTMVVLGIVVHGDREDTGLVMIALQPLTYLALSFLAVSLERLPLWTRRLWYGGTLIDLTLGIASALWFEITTDEWARTPNWAIKEDAQVVFLGDYVSTPAIPAILLVASVVVVAGFAARRLLTAPRLTSPAKGTAS